MPNNCTLQRSTKAWITHCTTDPVTDRYQSYDDQPAIIWSDGRKEWYDNGYLHRDNDLPAIVNGNHKEWCQHGQLHRIGGPAIMGRYNDQQDSHWLNGRWHSYEEYQKYMLYTHLVDYTCNGMTD